MQNTPQNRKRPAPGAQPVTQQQQPIPQSNYQYQQIPDNADFTNFDFSTPLPDPNYTTSAFDNNNLNAYGLNGGQPQTYQTNLPPAAPSTELVRRTRNQQVAVQNGQQEQWNGAAPTGSTEDEDEVELDRRADVAQKDGTAKRKQIPPFIQKLSSFLEGEDHTDLIRWSDDGKSFIVLDEDEFARTLIPELFKHNNYASFVRQLNMYGFHKTINITDGSLRQSEKARKGLKPPSMYSHKYFQRNRPKLLWLINKPGNKASAKRKRDGGIKEQYDSDDERQFSPVPESRIQELGAPNNTSLDLAQLPRNEIAAVRSEVNKLQTQQNYIKQMITQLKEQNDQFYRQASAFQALHDRHEDSINAILTFLATFYNRSLQGQGAQNLDNFLSNATAHRNQQHGSVVEEYTDSPPDPQANTQLQRYVKRPQLLLPGPNTATANQTLQPGSATTEPNSARASVSPPGDGSRTSVGPSNPQNASTAASPAVKAEAQTPTANDEMMSLINSVNANTQANTPNSTTASARDDFDLIVDQYQNLTGNPLTQQQRDSTLAAMMQGQNGPSAGNNNALTHPAPPALDLEKLRKNGNTIEQLQNLQKQNQQSLQELGRRLSPHSPTGNIPGLVRDVGQDPFDLTGAPGDYDPDNFINFDDNEWNGAGDDAEFDFGFDTSATGAAANNWTGNLDGAAGMDDGSEMFGSAPADGNLLAPAQGGGSVGSMGSGSPSPAGARVGEAGGSIKRQRRS
ncbi:Heat shock transcription factor [Extremus antarcticus]|uniref:Heat shock transcription factor n=1 Tax=Extremus antarcticus TaxID=702011 RepID=A0AAJ0DH15_9PEZI|nr:Heat shock transcription factor [Extremus antarcticus]